MKDVTRLVLDAIPRYELFWYLVVARLKLTKKDLMLGYIWWLLDPLILMVVYWFLVTIIFERGGENYAFFILCGLIPFRAISSSVNQSVSSVVSKFNLISQIKFPRVFLPLADVTANHIKLLAGFLVILTVGCFYGYFPTIYLPLIIIPFVCQWLLISALALFLSILGAYVRDIRNLTPFVTRFWMYISPVLFSVEDIPDKLRVFFEYNPIAPIIECYRLIFMQELNSPYQVFDKIMYPFFLGLILSILGLLFFAKSEKQILKRL